MPVLRRAATRVIRAEALRVFMVETVFERGV
jgi:hypothetical protein